MKNWVFSTFDCNLEIIIKIATDCNIIVIVGKFHSEKNYEQLFFPKKKKNFLRHRQNGRFCYFGTEPLLGIEHFFSSYLTYKIIKRTKYIYIHLVFCTLYNFWHFESLTLTRGKRTKGARERDRAKMVRPTLLDIGVTEREKNKQGWDGQRRFGWGSKFGKTKCRTTDIPKFQNCEY